MEFVSDINLNKQLIAILDNNSLKVFFSTYTAMGYQKETIHSFFQYSKYIKVLIFTSSLFNYQNQNYLVASDNNGKIYSLDIANLKISLSSSKIQFYSRNT